MPKPSGVSDNHDKHTPSNTFRMLSKREIYANVILLCLFNLVNYMDRYTIIAVAASELKPRFELADDQIGLISSIFIVSYMIFSPPAGYFGDRCNRKWLIVGGAIVWMGSVVAGSFITQEMGFTWLLASRALFGVGEACYVNVAPAIIHDLFYEDNTRTNMLILFNLAVPVGGGLGYILGSWANQKFGHWHWAMRCTLPLGAVVLVAYILLAPDVPHAYSEQIEAKRLNRSDDNREIPLLDGNTSDESDEPDVLKQSNLVEAIKDFLRIKTYVYSTIGFIVVCFVMGAGTTWLPILFYRAERMHGLSSSSTDELSKNFEFIPCSNYNKNFNFSVTHCDSQTLEVLDGEFQECEEFFSSKLLKDPTDIATQCFCRCDKLSKALNSAVFIKFGTLATLSGVVGALVGGELSKRWKARGNTRAESDVCAVGLLFGTVCLYICIVLVGTAKLSILAWTMYFFGLTCINFNWALVAKIVLGIVQPKQKSLAKSVFNTVAHVFGDAVSAWLIGHFAKKMGEVFREDIEQNQAGGDSESLDEWVDFLQLQQAMLILPLVCAIGSVAFFYASLYITADTAAITDGITGRRNAAKLPASAGESSGDETDGSRKKLHSR